MQNGMLQIPAMSQPNPHYTVACAVIRKEGRILAAQRSAAMSLPLKWEFPGGKIESGETPEGCLHRELQEELGITVRVVQGIEPVTHQYPTFGVTLYPFWCDHLQGEVILHEHSAIRWLEPEELPTLDWAAADWPIIAQLVRGP